MCMWTIGSGKMHANRCCRGQFNREKIPERVVHARGAGAKGYFEVSSSVCMHVSACAIPWDSPGSGIRAMPESPWVAEQVTNDLTHLTAASFMSSVGKRTPVAARLSTVVHERGCARRCPLLP